MRPRDSMAMATLPEDTRGQVAIEMEAIYIAIEKAAALTADLIEKLHPALNADAFGTKGAEPAPHPPLCPLATELRRDTSMLRDAVNGKLAELLQFIEL